jgi:hypothetical protein
MAKSLNPCFRRVAKMAWAILAAGQTGNFYEISTPIDKLKGPKLLPGLTTIISLTEAHRLIWKNLPRLNFLVVG